MRTPCVCHSVTVKNSQGQFVLSERSENRLSFFFGLLVFCVICLKPRLLIQTSFQSADRPEPEPELSNQQNCVTIFPEKRERN